MPVKCLPADKPKILFYGAMMAIRTPPIQPCASPRATASPARFPTRLSGVPRPENYGFYSMYYPLYLAVPPAAECGTLRFWLGFFALDCFVESFCVLWMAMGGYVEDRRWFAFGWVLHLLVALPYCVCSVAIPYTVYTGDGLTCRTTHMGPHGDALLPVVWLHVALFLVYVWMMLSITYYSWAKATLFASKQVANVAWS
jgi:hypothetical protein